MYEAGTIETGGEPSPASAADCWQDALLAAKILKAGGRGIGGVWLRARAGGVRDAYCDHLRAMLGRERAWIRMPPAASTAALAGTMDIAATASTGRLVIQPGLLARADGCVLLVPMAERLDARSASLIGDAMDNGSLPPARGSREQDARQPARFAVIAIDESAGPEESLPGALADRLGLFIDLNEVGWSSVVLPEPPGTRQATCPVDDVSMGDELLRLTCAIVAAAGVGSSRKLAHIVRISRIIASIDGRDSVCEPDVFTALRLSIGLALSPTSPPQEPVEQEPDSGEACGQPEPEPEADPKPEANGAETDPGEAQPSPSALNEVLCAIEAGQLDGMPEFRNPAGGARNMRTATGRSGIALKGARRGRTVGTSSTAPYRDARIHIISTLRAAAPWQSIRLRKRQALLATLAERGPAPLVRPRTLITREDYRYQRLRDETSSTAIFLVDASGSTALERLGETKGVIEQLLARCYIRRDEVAMIAFRGTDAQTVLPPTRSLVMAKRKLAGLPGGGATPLVAGLEKGLELAMSVRRQGSTPLVVLLTDGRGNIARNGSPDRALAEEQLAGMATRYRSFDMRTICIDIGRRPREAVAELAGAMGADLHFLRQANAKQVSSLVDDCLQEARQ
jgi:magnesium chelatase subunit D